MNPMTMRTTRTTLTFKRPFVLDDIGIQAAGTYDIDTDEELMEDISFLAYRRVATFLHVRKNGATQVHRVDPVELEAAHMRDSGLTVVSATGARENYS